MSEKSEGERKLDALIAATDEVCTPIACRVGRGGNRTTFQHGEQRIEFSIELTPEQVGDTVRRFLREEVHAA